MQEIAFISGKSVSIVKTGDISLIAVGLKLPNGTYFLKDVNTGKTLKFTTEY